MVYSVFLKQKNILIIKTLIISYSDIIYSKDILQKLIKKKGDIVVAIDKNFKKYWMKRFKNPLDDIESCKIKKNQIYDIGRKVNSFTEIDGQYIGLIKLSSKGSKIFCQVHKDLKKYNKDVLKKMYMTDFLQILIKKGHKLTACKFYTPWIEVDNQNDLKIIEHKNRIKKILNS
jgi:choline kinase